MKSILNNGPELWSDHFTMPKADAYKYDRGHAVILGAPELTGATRLAATACSRIGAGLVTVLAGERSDIYRMTLPADIMVRVGDIADLTHVTAVLGGSGGVTPAQQNMLQMNLSGITRILDAGAIPTGPDQSILDAQCVLTPHSGEFKRAFPELCGPKGRCAQHAAQQSGAIIVFKGPQTFIAHPDGRLVVNDRPNPNLAKAGTGDVLAGFITGLVAQNIPPFYAACAAVWMHSEAAQKMGRGLTACDLETAIPAILQSL